MHAQTIADRLRDDMLAGLLPPGAKLGQADLAERFAVSRIPVRDALALLATQGLVALAPNKGATVIEMRRADIIEAYDLRILLECDLLHRAMAHMTTASHAEIDYALKRSNLEAHGPHAADGDRLFHDALYTAANRPRQNAMILTLRHACQIQIAAYDSLPAHTDQWLADHKAIVAHILAADTPAATARLQTHLRATKEALLAAMG